MRKCVWIADKPTLYKNVIARYTAKSWIRPPSWLSLRSSEIRHRRRRSRRQLSECFSARAKVSNNITATDSKWEAQPDFVAFAKLLRGAFVERKGNTMSELHFPNVDYVPFSLPLSLSECERERVRKTLQPGTSHLVPKSARDFVLARVLHSFPEKFSIARRDGRKSIIVRDVAGSLLSKKIALRYLRSVFGLSVASDAIEKREKKNAPNE